MVERNDLGAQAAALEAAMAALGSAGDVVSAFDGQVRGLGRSLTFSGREMDGLSRSLGTGLRRAFDGVVFDGMRMGDALRLVLRRATDSVYEMAMRPVQQGLGRLLAGGIAGIGGAVAPFADGGAFLQGRVMPFAQGGIVTRPTAFPMRGGTGLMGEAGPEAIMPLSRGPDGRLGVRAGAGGGAPVVVTINVTTPDAEGFRRSRTQVAAEVARAIERAQRNR